MFTKLKNARADLATMNRLLPRAEHVAASCGSEIPGAEHLLAAAIDLPDGIAAQVLGARGVDRESWLAAVAHQHDDALRTIGIDSTVGDLAGPPVPAGPPAGPLRSQESLREVFGRAVRAAKETRRPLSSGEILLAAAEPEHGTVARTLAHLGIDRAALAADLRTRLTDG